MKRSIFIFGLLLICASVFPRTTLFYNIKDYKTPIFKSTLLPALAPPIVTTSQSFSILENSSSNTPVGTVVATDPDGTTTFQDWTISTNIDPNGNGTDAFAIDPSSGQITVNDPLDLDYEKDESLTISITVSDGTEISTPESVIINITNDNDNSPIVGENQSFPIDENTSEGTSVGIITATDDDNGTTVFQDWTITTNTDPNSDGEDAFAINSSNGEITVNDPGDLNYETNTSLTISVTVSDGTNTSIGRSVTITLNNLNDEKPVITSGQTFSILENSSNNSSVGNINATDGDIGTTNFEQWTISTNTDPDGNGTDAFTINENTGEITVTDSGDLDRELNTSLNISVTVSDGTNTSDPVSITINLTDQNDDAPSITAGQSLDINENSVSGTNIGLVNATDSDSGTTFQNWTIVTNVDPNGNGTNAFDIDATSGQIEVNDASDLDYEENTSFSITLTVSDGINTSAEESISIEVNNINDVIPVITASQNFSIDENSDIDDIVGTVVATDGDSGTTTFQDWTITDNVNGDGDGNNAFDINPSTGEITVNDEDDLDYETNTSLTISVNVRDGSNTSSAVPIVINLNNLNDNTPTITTDQSFTVNENISNDNTVGTVVATDKDAGTTTFQNWTITLNTNGDNDENDAFSIDASTGVITVNDSDDIDFETNTSYSIQITVSDGINTSEPATVTINLTDENDLVPVITSGQTVSVDENSDNGTSIGTVEATDGDAGTVFQNWTITTNIDIDNDGNDAFAIDNASGEITVNDSDDIDFETNTSYTVAVSVSDGVNTSNSENVTINIKDVNDIAPVITEGQSLTVNEHASNGTTLGTILATDADTVETSYQDWTIVENIDTDNDGNYAYSVDSTTGVISVNDTDDIDFENSESHNITLTVSDGINTSEAANIVINVKDINDSAPIITPMQSFNIEENSATLTLIGTILATDPDTIETNFSSWKITINVDPDEDGNNAFSIDSLTGQLWVNDPKDLDFEENASFIISVTVSDSINTSEPEDIYIYMEDLNDNVPVITPFQYFTINENLSNDSLVGTIIATDWDVTPTIFQDWQITTNVDPNENGNPAFAINTASGELLVNDSLDLDYEQNTSFTIKVTVSDSIHTSDSTEVIITLLDVNDILPVITPDQIFSIYENATAGSLVDTIVATDADSTATIFSKWTISTNIDPNANDTSAFEIDSITGIITVKDSSDLDYEKNTTLEIYATVYDGVNTSLPEKITIALKDKNDVVPLVTPDQSFTIQENTINGTLLGSLVATDGDITPTTFNQWTISTNSDADNDGNGAFALDTLSGTLTINDVDDIDYEKNIDITIEVTVSDSVNTSLPEKITVHLTDLNDVIPEITKGQNFIVSEDVENAVSVGIVEASDGDITPTIFSNWTISTNVDPDKDGIMTFAINPENGEIFVNDADEIDFENDPKYYIAINVFDGVNTSIPRVVTIYIDNLEDETPVITPGQVFYLNEDAVRRTIVCIPEAKDRDDGMVILQNWTILNNPDSDGDGSPAFKIDDDTGKITVNDTDDIDYETNNEIPLRLTVSDGTNTSIEEIVLIKINRILSVNNKEQIDFNIFPNPVVDYAIIKTKIQGILYIINDKGQQVRQMNITEYETSISVQNLTNGLYYFVFRTNKTNISKKIIVKNR